ncbi:MAG: class I SAM-dependent methyltransferase [Chloroflexi bacterium]|nr:class I SAM-dependent methyltransferase [Chloroflexota bacterium]
MHPATNPDGATVKRKTACPICASSAITPVLDIEQVPVHCNVLWLTQAEARDAPRGDLHLSFCPDCGHLFNTTFDPALMEYDEVYENSLHFSPRFQQYAESLAKRLVETYDLHNKDIVEIGSGKGDFLKLLCDLGDNRGVGFDPSYEPEHGLESGNVRFVQDFYGEKYGNQQADLICCRHVLEHIEFPQDFMHSVRRSVSDQSGVVVYFEVPNAAYTLRDMGIWDLIYEHCSYFSLPSLRRVFAASGFRVVQAAEAYAGQFLGIEATPNGQPAQDIGAETLEALREHVAAFGDQYRRKVQSWRQRLAEFAAAGQRVVIWGSGSKGVTFLNVLQTQDQIAYAVDINPRKQGRFVAGTGQQLVAPEFLHEYEPDVILIMNPVYEDEIRRSVAELGLTPRLYLV